MNLLINGVIGINLSKNPRDASGSAVLFSAKEFLGIYLLQ